MQPCNLPLIPAGFIRLGAGACFVWVLIFGQAVVSPAEDTGEVSRISVHQTRNVLGRPDTAVIDVRTYRNWWRSSKKIPTAVRRDPTRIDQWMEKYTRDQTLIFYCS